MSTLSKSELIAHITKTTKISSADVDAVVTTLLDTITETLKSGGEVKFLGFGSFAVQSSAAREGRNPRTGETLQIKASKRPVFKAGKNFKDAVNG
ncbi:MAG: HU family DNA-binding protein [Candidatus Paracaedibacteraceae bacterium]|nr:HU family DNA-binding protein [Candidatus Paracaedibacteraceae bacterium]